MNIFRASNFYSKGVDSIKKIAKTVLIVTALSCIERAIGFVYRIFLSRNVGAEGLGLYQIVLSVIGVLITFATSGIPITVSRLMIKERAAGRRDGEFAALTAGMAVTVAICVPVCLFFFIFKGSLSLIFTDQRCNILFLIILPGVTLTAVYAVIRGFFWGTKSFYTYSVIELAEEAVMVICGVFAISRVSTLMQKAVWASTSVLISYVFSFTLSLAVFIIKGGRLKKPTGLVKPLVSSAMPITFMRTANSATSSLIAIILPAALIAAGSDPQNAISQFGVISGMTLPLLFIPSTIIGSVSLVIVPELTENFYKKKTESIRSSVEKSLLYCTLIAMLIIPAFAGMGDFVGALIYKNDLAGKYLQYCAITMFPMSVTMISNSLLNSMGLEKKTLKYYVISAVALLACVTLLPRFMGSYSLILGYFLSFTITAVLNIKLLKKTCMQRLDFVKRLASCIPVCLLSCLFCYFSFKLFCTFTPPLLAFCICYLLTLLFMVICLYCLNVLPSINRKKPAYSTVNANSNRR